MPQESKDSTTWSPTASPVTRGPAASMLREPWWPRMTGSPTRPLRPSRSVWHRPAPAILTRTSPGPGSFSSTCSTAYGASAARSTAAVISKASALQGVANGQVLEAADEGGGGPLGPAGELDGFQAGQELGEQGAGLHPGQGGAEAVVDAEPEREVLVGVAAGVEAERVGEDLLVAVAGGIGQQHRLTLLDGDAADLGVGGGGAHELLDRGDPADHLVRGGRQQGGVVSQPGQLSGMLCCGAPAPWAGGAGGVVGGRRG